MYFSEWYGDLPVQPRPRPSLLTPGPQLVMPPHEIINFARDSAGLSAPQLKKITSTAQFIANTWPSGAAVTSIRLTGYIFSEEWKPGLGEQRALAVRDALMSALKGLSAGLPTRIQWIIEDRGAADLPKVEIYLWSGPTPPPIPPLVRNPSKAELMRSVTPPGPETAEQRIQKILKTLPPAPPPKRSFTDMFWQKVDEKLNSTMNRLDVPRSLRGHIRDGIHAAIRRGSEALLNQIVSATGLPSEVQDAIRGTARALVQVPTR